MTVIPPFLHELPEEALHPLLESARWRRFARGEIVFHEGDVGDTLHIVQNGRFSIRVSTPYGDTATLAFVGVGEIFGEMAVLDDDVVRSATVAAIEDGETLSLRRTQIDDLRKNHPSVTDTLVIILRDKLRRYTNHLVEALYVPVDARVLRRLLELAEIYPQTGDETIIPVVQDDLAGLAGTTRASVNRILRKEEERGLVRLERGKITLVDRDRLAQRAKI